MNHPLTYPCSALLFTPSSWYLFHIIALLATLTTSTLATPVSVLDHYSPLKVAVSHTPVAIAQHVPVAHHEIIDVEHYVSAAVAVLSETLVVVPTSR